MDRLIRFAVCAAWMLTICMPTLFAQANSDGLGEAYLSIPVGARAAALAGAYTAVANEPNALFFNPGALGFIAAENQFALMTSPMQFGRTHAALAYARSFDETFAISGGINSIQHSSFTARNIQGQSIGEFTNRQYAFTLGGAWRYDFLALGAAGKYLLNELNGSDARGSGFALDLGAKANIADMFTFGLAFQNIGARLNWNSSTGNDLTPYTVRAGLATEIGLDDDELISRSTVRGDMQTVLMPSTRYILLTAEAVLQQYANTPTLMLGTEIQLIQDFAIRGGAAIYGPDKGKNVFMPLTSWGAGLSLRPSFANLPFPMQIDYALAGDYLSGNGISHHFTLLFQI